MKKILLYTAFLAALLCACNESKFLDEKPLDFMSGDNSYSTQADFDAAITELYYLTRVEFYCNGGSSLDYLMGTDLLMGAGKNSNLLNDMAPTASGPQTHWDKLYLLIAQANTVISRLEASALTEDQKVKYEAKARFFRGFGYRTLAYLFGGVPLQLEEVNAPKTDYVRASREDVLNQALEDVKFTTEHLKDEITAVRDGEISLPAAYFLLSELYLAVGNNDEAAKAATRVIDSPGLALMTQRFGSRKDEPGDVYYDLFRRNNQNRSAGNTEGIWVIQIQEDVPGGSASTSFYFWDTGNYLLERHCAPQVQHFRFVNEATGESTTPFDWPIGDFTGGRGTGVYIPAPLFYEGVWVSDFDNDMRNSNYNMVRKFKYNKPDFINKYGSIFGDSLDLTDLGNLPAGWIIKSDADDFPSRVPNHAMTAYSTKCTTPYNHPAKVYANASTYMLSSAGGGSTYTDQYMFRLAEAYLLRAEAYLKMGHPDKAADDINVIRDRANASPVAADDVDMNYILDERIRELGLEEKRRLTLARTGLFYDRVKNYNPFYNAEYSVDKKDFQETYTLYPIPQSAIQANKDAKLEQNPGY